jgi:hypothetical protein
LLRDEERQMIWPKVTPVSLILLAIAAEAGCPAKDHFDVPSKKTQTVPEISPEQARAALLNLGTLPVITGRDDDPLILDLKLGAVVRTDDSVVTIGRFFSCDLKKKTWRMSVSNSGTGRLHWSAGADGHFEIQSDGTWRAIQASGYIT